MYTLEARAANPRSIITVSPGFGDLDQATVARTGGAER